MYKYSLLILILAMPGCASSSYTEVADDLIPVMSTKLLLLSQRPVPAFNAATADKARFGVIGAMAMLATGKDLVEQNDIADPADFIAEQLSMDLAAAYGLAIADAERPLIPGSGLSHISRQATDADYLLDVQTNGWGFIYFPTDFNHFRVLYSASLELIDVNARKVIADGLCIWTPKEKDALSPDYEQLLANNAERLKEELMIAAGHCLAEFRLKSLKIQR